MTTCFGFPFLSLLQVGTLGYFNTQLTLLLSMRSRLHKFINKYINKNMYLSLSFKYYLVIRVYFIQAG
jgi:hypothetical protein